MFNKLKQLKLGGKVIKCPSCSKPLRVPFKSGKTLRVNCPHCSVMFDVRFTNPLGELLKWDRTLPVSANLKGLASRFRTLPSSGKLSIILFIVSLLFLMWAFLGHLIVPVDSTPPPTQKTLNF